MSHVFQKFKDNVFDMSGIKTNMQIPYMPYVFPFSVVSQSRSHKSPLCVLCDEYFDHINGEIVGVRASVLTILVKHGNSIFLAPLYTGEIPTVRKAKASDFKQIAVTGRWTFMCNSNMHAAHSRRCYADSETNNDMTTINVVGSMWQCNACKAAAEAWHASNFDPSRVYTKEAILGRATPAGRRILNAALFGRNLYDMTSAVLHRVSLDVDPLRTLSRLERTCSTEQYMPTIIRDALDKTSTALIWQTRSKRQKLRHTGIITSKQTITDPTFVDVTCAVYATPHETRTYAYAAYAEFAVMLLRIRNQIGYCDADMTHNNLPGSLTSFSFHPEKKINIVTAYTVPPGVTFDDVTREFVFSYNDIVRTNHTFDTKDGTVLLVGPFTFQQLSTLFASHLCIDDTNVGVVWLHNKLVLHSVHATLNVFHALVASDLFVDLSHLADQARPPELQPVHKALFARMRADALVHYADLAPIIPAGRGQQTYLAPYNQENFVFIEDAYDLPMLATFLYFNPCDVDNQKIACARKDFSLATSRLLMPNSHNIFCVLNTQ